MTSFGRRRVPTTVYLNVYDLAPINELLYPIGFGLHHTGVEILGSEYTFAAESGIFHHTPRAVPDAKFRTQLVLGHFDGGESDVRRAISNLTDGFGPGEYNVIYRNCNHFSNALSMELLRKGIPSHVNRLAALGVCCSCFIPKDVQSGNGSKPTEESRTFLQSQKNPASVSGVTQAFQGTGSQLGGTVAESTLTDRRERSRLAALARLEKQRDQSS